MKTEVTVGKCGSTILGPVRLDRQTGSPCYGTIICILQLELSSLKHGISAKHIPTTFKMSDSYVSSTDASSVQFTFMQHFPKRKFDMVSYLLKHFQMVFCPDDSPGLHLACAIRQHDKQIHVRKRRCVCFTRANRVMCT